MNKKKSNTHHERHMHGFGDEKFACLFVLLFLIPCLYRPTSVNGQITESANLVGHHRPNTQISITKYPLISEVRGDLITIDRGEDYWLTEGTIVEVWRFDPTANGASSLAHEKIGQARIIQVRNQASIARVLGEPDALIELEDFVRVHPEVVQIEPGEITIDRGVNQGLIAGRVVTLWRYEPMDTAMTMDAGARKIVGRALLTDVQPEMSTARVLGKVFDPLVAGDMVRVDKRTTVRQRSGNTVYLNVATDLINVLKPGMKVHVFRPHMLMHPNGSRQIIRWQEHIADLKINHVAPASYTAWAAIEGEAQSDVLPEDLIAIEDIQMDKRLKSYEETHVLKIEPDRIYLNHFEEARPGIQLTIVRKQPTSEEIDPTAPIYNLQVEAVHEHVVTATFLNNPTNRAFLPGDRVRYAIYR